MTAKNVLKRKAELKRIAELLHQRRRAVTESSHQARIELRGLKEQEKDPEYEEGAQSELADFTLSTLLENARHETTQIDAALARMELGVFGQCVDCGTEIPMERLEALPFAIRCEEDARIREHRDRGGHYQAPSL